METCIYDEIRKETETYLDSYKKLIANVNHIADVKDDLGIAIQNLTPDVKREKEKPGEASQLNELVQSAILAGPSQMEPIIHDLDLVKSLEQSLRSTLAEGIQAALLQSTGRLDKNKQASKFWGWLYAKNSTSDPRRLYSDQEGSMVVDIAQVVQIFHDKLKPVMMNKSTYWSGSSIKTGDSPYLVTIKIPNDILRKGSISESKEEKPREPDVCPPKFEERVTEYLGCEAPDLRWVLEENRFQQEILSLRVNPIHASTPAPENVSRLLRQENIVQTLFDLPRSFVSTPMTAADLMSRIESFFKGYTGLMRLYQYTLGKEVTCYVDPTRSNIAFYKSGKNALYEAFPSCNFKEKRVTSEDYGLLCTAFVVMKSISGFQVA